MTILIYLAITFAHASAQDPYNTYLWNRHNAVEKNGLIDRGDWFEWWYYKVVDPQTREAFFFTYGVVNPWDTDQTLDGTKAAVQAGDFQNHILVSANFPLTQFAAHHSRTDVNVGGNRATDKHLTGKVSENGHAMEWDLSVTQDWKFAAMGWAMDAPEISGIYWYPAQAAATMNGWIRVDGVTHNMTDTPAYQDRNWGRTFPKWWTWLTSNHFKDSPGTTLAAGGGEPKVFSSVYLFSGLCIGLKHQGKEYVFRSTDLDNIQFDIRWGVWNVTAENSHGQRIEISAYAPPAQFMMLPFQSPRGPLFYDYEALLGKMSVKIFTRETILSAWNQVADLETSEAGIEWGTPEPIDSTAPLSLTGLFVNSVNLQ